jgi:pimeloyl-ACP methyl ester carboxylesterase
MPGRWLLAGNRRSVWRAVNGVIERQGVEDELQRIVAPTLVIAGEEDTATPPDDVERLAALIPKAQLVRIPAAGHSSTIEQPALVTAAIRRFLEDVRVAERCGRL